MRENKVYTKTGDEGITSLISGKRVPKHDIRIKAYGSIDELIAWIGLIRDTTNLSYVKSTLMEVQSQLMTIAAQLAVDTDENFPSNLKPIDTNSITFIEKEIDNLTEKLTPLKNFLIPGGHKLISYAHIVRCITRRSERYVTELDQNFPISGTVIAYINRLSDYFFTLSRTFAAELKIEEVKWSGN
mgnify:FL=1|tara:strand:+ start:339 stop:896 length:558 start_codon:yes stop_codon:yes gene_type:complete